MTRQSTDSILLTPQQMAAVDRLALESGVAERILVANAGRAVAAEIARRYAARPVLVLCGPGNNGADGLVAARYLAHWGWKATVARVGASLRSEAAAPWNDPIQVARPELVRDHRLIVDAVFGAGLSRPLTGETESLVEAVNGSDAPIVAVDIPSGIDGADGQVRGSAVRAQLTVSFARAKPGHLLLPGRTHCGELVIADIGIPERAVVAAAGNTSWNVPSLWRQTLPERTETSHKYRHGHALAVSGPAWSTGAIRLSAAAALRAGAGLVTIASPFEALPVHAAHSTAIMLREAGSPAKLEKILADRRISAVLVGPGCGIGSDTRAMARVCLASSAAAVLDADALTAFAGAPRELQTCIAENPGRGVVMTPHDAEFDRLTTGQFATKSKLDRCRAAAALFGSVIVLKGADTVVAAPDGRASIASNAPPDLATAGSGDVLAGIVLGLLAQCMAPFEAASAAVWMHGEAAAAFGPGLTASDLPQLLPRVLEDLATRNVPSPLTKRAGP